MDQNVPRQPTQTSPKSDTFKTHPPPQPRLAVDSPHTPSPVSAGLRLHTDTLFQHQLHGKYPQTADNVVPLTEISSRQTTGLPVRNSSVRSTLSASHHAVGTRSPASVLSSPGLGPIVDITPLPSPVTRSGSPGKWKRLRESLDSEDSRSTTAKETANRLSPSASFVRMSASRPRASTGQAASSTEDAPVYDVNASSHGRQPNFSEYSPDPLQVPRHLNAVVASPVPMLIEEQLTSPNQHLHREEYLAVKRGLTMPRSNLPTPPRSTRDTDESESESTPSSSKAAGNKPTYYQARSIHSGKLRRWRELRKVGQGTFSTVVLAVSDGVEDENLRIQSTRFRQAAEECHFSPKSLVAVKICEHGPAGGADEARIKSSLTRELEILKAIDHPSLVHLKAVNVLDNRTYMVLSYCAGGDLYDLSFNRPDLLTPAFIQRVFAELVSAVRYLHSQYIVHRDIKLENVLVNLPLDAFASVPNWQTYHSPIVILTDLGLGRDIPRPPESPLLETRCGSEDYAAPELLLGQPYDGRATDAWALGVLLYALMEQRLPFDQLPGAKRKSQKSHRIARCEWGWQRWAREDGEWDPVKGEALEGANIVVEGLLARSRNRWGLDKVEETAWVNKGILRESPLRRDDDEGDEDEG